MNVLILLFFYLLIVSGFSLITKREHVSFWHLLPLETMWKNISFTVKDDIQLSKYITNYLLPLIQLQGACRNDNLSPEIIRKNVINVIDTSISIVDNLNFSQDTFDKCSEDLLEFIDDSLNTVILSSQLDIIASPTFSSRSVFLWLHQRLTDMVAGSCSYFTFLEDKRFFKRNLYNLKNNLSSMSGFQIKHLVRITEDFFEIQKRETIYFTILRKQILNDQANTSEMGNVYHNIKMLGNNSLKKAESCFNIYFIYFLLLLQAII